MSSATDQPTVWPRPGEERQGSRAESEEYGDPHLNGAGSEHAARVQRARVACIPWRRVSSPSPTARHISPAARSGLTPPAEWHHEAKPAALTLITSGRRERPAWRPRRGVGVLRWAMNDADGVLRRRPLPDDPSLAPWPPRLTALLPGAVAGGPAARLGRGVDSQAVRGRLCSSCFGAWALMGWWSPWRTCTGRTPIRCPLAEYLADNACDQHLVFAVSLRTEPPSPASELARRQRGRRGIAHLPLGRLSEREVAEMIIACSPGADAEERIRIGRASEGVPLKDCWPRPASRSPSARRYGTAGRAPRPRARRPGGGDNGASL